MQIGMTELVLVFIVALFALGPDRLPAYARKLGEAVSQFKKYSDEATQEIKKSVVEPLEEVQAPLREAVRPLEDLDKTVQENARDLKKSFADIGKEKPPDKPPSKEKTKETEDTENRTDETDAVDKAAAGETESA